MLTTSVLLSRLKPPQYFPRKSRRDVNETGGEADSASLPCLLPPARWRSFKSQIFSYENVISLVASVFYGNCHTHNKVTRSVRLHFFFAHTNTNLKFAFVATPNGEENMAYELL